MKAIARFGYTDYCFDVSAIPFIASAFPLTTVRGGYHPEEGFEGIEIKIVSEEKLRMTEEEQQKDYKKEAESNNKMWLDAYNEKNKLETKVTELTAALDALKAVCPHPAAPEPSNEK